MGTVLWEYRDPSTELLASFSKLFDCASNRIDFMNHVSLMAKEGYQGRDFERCLEFIVEREIIPLWRMQVTLAASPIVQAILLNMANHLTEVKVGQESTIEYETRLKYAVLTVCHVFEKDFASSDVMVNVMSGVICVALIKTTLYSRLQNVILKKSIPVLGKGSSL